ncbi:hypothetical protein Hanom_Chr05g00473051 [Helianthus anomalus]
MLLNVFMIMYGLLKAQFLNVFMIMYNDLYNFSISLCVEPIIRMKSATNPTEMGGNIAVTVTRSPSLSTRVPTSVCSRILVFALCMHNQIFMGALTKIRTRMTNDNSSAFEINENGLLMIIAISAFLAVEVSSQIMFFTKIPSKCYAILKFFAIFSASISPFLLLMVLDVSPSILCLLGYVFGGIVIAYACSGDDDADKNLDKRSPVAIFTYSGLFLIPLSLVLVLFVPINLDWIVYSVIYPIFGVEMICFFIIYFKFTVMSIYQTLPNLRSSSRYPSRQEHE